MTLLAFLFGVACGAWCAWFMWMRHAKPTVEITIAPETLRLINSKMVAEWLEARGLVWMPKGVDFKAQKEERK